MKSIMPRKRYDLNQWREHGQGLVEYALILVAVAIVIIAILTFLGQIVFIDMYSKISSSMPS